MPPAPPPLLAASDPTGPHLAAHAQEQRVYPLAGQAAPWFAGAAAVLCGLALYIGFFVLPSDIAQGEHYRILLIHVPASWVALAVFVTMAGAAAAAALLEQRMFAMLASALAPTGAMFAFLALWTGSLWGKPNWGVWWVWDPWLASQLALLALFLVFMGLQAAIEDARLADRAGVGLALAGLVLLPLAYVVAEQWGGAQHGTSIALSVLPGVRGMLQAGTHVMGIGLAAYAVAAALTRLRIVILERERRSEWVARLAGD